MEHPLEDKEDNNHHSGGHHRQTRRFEPAVTDLPREEVPPELLHAYDILMGQGHGSSALSD